MEIPARAEKRDRIPLPLEEHDRLWLLHIAEDKGQRRHERTSFIFIGAERFAIGHELLLEQRSRAVSRKAGHVEPALAFRPAVARRLIETLMIAHAIERSGRHLKPWRLHGEGSLARRVL